MKIAVMGTGGLGGYFGGRLAHAGLDVTFIARGAHLQAMRESGLLVKGPHGDFRVQPVQVTDQPAEVGPVDVVLFCVKAYDAVNAAEQMKPLMGAQTTLIPVLNGIDHIDLLNRTLGAEHMLGGVAAISAHKMAPGVIEQIGPLHRLEFGEMGGGVSARVTAIQTVLAAGGFAVNATPTIVESLWKKLVSLTGMGVCSVMRGNIGTLLSHPETVDLARRAMAETTTVGQAKGVALSQTLPAETIERVKTLSPLEKPSMFFDLEHGNRIEVEWLNGAVARMGREVGVPTPVNDFIYACLKPWANGAP